MILPIERCCSVGFYLFLACGGNLENREWFNLVRRTSLQTLAFLGKGVKCL